jgi:PAS domain S-box-containing protein
MKLSWMTLRVPGPVFVAAGLVLATNVLAPLLLWHPATQPGESVGPALVFGSIVITTIADLALFVWLYGKLMRRYVERLELGIASAMDAVIAVGPQGQIVLFNPAAQVMFGYEPREVMGKPLELLMPERHRAAHREGLAEFAASGAPHVAFGRRRGVVGLRSNGEEFPIEGYVSRVGEGADRLLAFTLRDVTVRRNARVQLARLAAIVESSSDAIMSIQLDGTVTSWNTGAEYIFGFTAGEMLGQSIKRLIPPQREGEEEWILARIRTGEWIEHFQTVRRRKDGSDIDVSISVAPLRDETGRVVGASKIARDVSEQHRAAQAQRNYVTRLQELSRRLMGTEEEERRRLANELHDCTGSNLTALATTLAQMRATLAPEVVREQAARFAECDLTLRETVEHVRNVLADLRPTALDLGLLAALRHHADRLRARTGMTLEVRGAEPQPRPGSDAEIALFRIAQEAINNALKHAGAQRVTVELSGARGALRLVVADDGKGFDAAQSRPGEGGLGMTTMRERAEAIRARLDITSVPGGGTRVSVQLDQRGERSHPW